MEFLNAQAKYISQQLRGMSVSQRAAVVLLLVIVTGGLWGIIRWGGESTWTELLPKDLTAEELQVVQAELASVGMQTKTEGNRILIRGNEDDRRRAHAILAQNNAMPRDTSLAYAVLAKDDNVFESDQKTKWKQLRGLETELSHVLRQFKGIQDATVLIEVPNKRGFRGDGGSSRASVHVSMRNGQALDKQRISAIANLIVGAVGGLALENVKITDGVRSYTAPDAADTMPTELLEVQRKEEEHRARKISHQLQYIPGVLVDVHATLRLVDEQVQKTEYGKPVVSHETSKTEEMTNPVTAAGPGVRPNVGRAIAEPTTGQTSTREESDTELGGKRDQENTLINKPMGYPERFAATVSVPRSYLVRLIREQQTDATTITQQMVAETATIELPRIREIVKPLINATEEDQVVVRWFSDLSPESQPTAEMAGQSGLIVLAKDYGPQAGLALLAAFSLFMVFRIAKKAQTTVALSSPGAAAQKGGAGLAGRSGVGGKSGRLPPLEGGVEAVGEAQGLEGFMVGQEVDEQLIRTQNMVKQISQFIEEDAATPAAILGGWIEAGD